MSAAPGSPAGIVPDRDGLAKLMRDVADIRREIRELRSQTVDAGNLSLPSGSAIALASGSGMNIHAGAAAAVFDGSGNQVATVGDLGGVQGVHAHDPVSGATLPLAQLAFGAVGANDGGTSFTQSTLNTWQAGPMSLVVVVKTGRLYVEAGAVITVVGIASTSSQAVMSWNIAGPTTIGPSLQRGFGAGVINGASPLPGFGQASRGYFHTGLTNGTYTITDQYQTDHGGSYVGRSLFVIPF